MEFGDKMKAIQSIKIDNPFTFKAGQVFTGFGVGCGVGIGVGRPINLAVLPMVGQVMSATRGATDAFSGVSRHVNEALRKVGAKNIEVGVGCGVGFGHGFGIGLAVKPGVLNQIQSYLVQGVTKLAAKVAPNLPIGQGSFPMSMQSGSTTMNQQSALPSPFGSVMQMPQSGLTTMNQQSVLPNPFGSVMQMPPSIPNHPFQGLSGQENMTTTSSSYQTFASESPPIETSFGRTENVISSFLQNQVSRGDETGASKLGNGLQSENNMLKMVLKHQEKIEELMEENSKLRQILVDDLKVPHGKLQGGSFTKNEASCSDCFECRRKQRRR